jgi:hypothetical protein
VNTFRHRFRVFFADGTSREVSARSIDGAKTTAASAQRLVGYKGLACRALSAEDMGHMGTSDRRSCPLCGGIFAEVEGGA